MIEELLRARAVLRGTEPGRRRDATIGADSADPSAGTPADVLYAHWFHGFDGTTRPFPAASAYRAAVLDPRRFEPGWRIVGVVPGQPGAIVAERAEDEDAPGAEARRFLVPSEYLPVDRTHLLPRVGDAVRVDPMITGESDGFWHAWSRGWRRQGAAPPLRRLYFAVAQGREEEFAAALFQAAPPDGPWYAKLLCGHHPSGRRDPAVIYVPQSIRWEESWPGALIDGTSGLRDDGAPPLTRRVAAGVAWAFDPGGDTSFGQAVCARLAAVFEQARADGDEMVDADWTAAASEALGELVRDDDPMPSRAPRSSDRRAS